MIIIIIIIIKIIIIIIMGALGGVVSPPSGVQRFFRLTRGQIASNFALNATNKSLSTPMFQACFRTLF